MWKVNSSSYQNPRIEWNTVVTANSRNSPSRLPSWRPRSDRLSGFDEAGSASEIRLDVMEVDLPAGQRGLHCPGRVGAGFPQDLE